MLKTTSFNVKNEISNLLILFGASILVAIGLWIFVYHAGFAPSGVDGIVTLLNYVTGINPGIFTFLINLPLLICAWFVLNKRYVIYTVLYTVIVSTTLLILEELGVYQYVCIEANGVVNLNNNRLLAAVFGGVAQGFTGILLRIGGSSGGVDVLGSMIHKKLPYKDLEKIIAILSYIIVAISFFVYDKDWNSVLLSIVEIFVCEKLTASILKTNRSAIKFEIITDNEQAEKIKRHVIFELKHGATIIDGQGAFSNDNKQIIMCLINYRQLPEFLKFIKSVPNTFLYYSDVKGIRGNFDFYESDETPEDYEKLQEKIKLENYKKD